MLSLGPAHLAVRLSAQIGEWQIDLPVQWGAAYHRFSVENVRAETGRVPGEPVWIARLEVDAPEFVAVLRLGGAPHAFVDGRLGVIEVAVAPGAVVIAIMPDGKASARSQDRLVLDGPTVQRLVRGDTATVAFAFGSDGLHARAALFPFLGGARSRAGLQAARFAQSSGASSST